MVDPDCQPNCVWSPLSDIPLGKSAGEDFPLEKAEPSGESSNIKSSNKKAGLLACPPLLASIALVLLLPQQPLSFTDLKTQFLD